ncbi:MAG: hemolysin, partial [Candidatus Nanosynbacter sp.]|nr:hemolysin [Candidatus Nanosynbacter sp.]
DGNTLIGHDDQDNILHGLDGNDTIYGGIGNDLLYGDAGDDTLIGNTGNDTLIGGQGKDTLRGGYGDDTYIFNKGDGVDYIEEERGDNDTIQFGEGITLKDLKFFRYDSSGRNLYITVGDNGDAISIKNYFNDGSYSRPTDTFKVEKLLFSDGTTIDAAYIYEQVRTITGSGDGNTLIGHDDQDNILHGLDGNDTIY